ncbi:Uncharacterised protein [Vibrio cholerae]|nr:Uncharacterised protein [Vibrio cholerae]
MRCHRPIPPNQVSIADKLEMHDRQPRCILERESVSYPFQKSVIDVGR